MYYNQEVGICALSSPPTILKFWLGRRGRRGGGDTRDRVGPGSEETSMNYMVECPSCLVSCVLRRRPLIGGLRKCPLHPGTCVPARMEKRQSPTNTSTLQQVSFGGFWIKGCEWLEGAAMCRTQALESFGNCPLPDRPRQTYSTPSCSVCHSCHLLSITKKRERKKKGTAYYYFCNFC